ncbi:wyosine [tRNA(Phe)-imidazoG37] synthetase (radical SAM superfamily) [Desulfobotulus alkaliphilus]|uniref:Wyosine [tRNA(Phe)-imidazoG37] synthetase (Radical SAM superfamily) n=1 Tax=Desulfobotulus alkaliphilus TaxID=622671 RepID=A0A562RGE2_9BACT|nr:radical SAM protein [Desulfobotulus alkaliphilus]TWI68152.1 wyosine [tRNA(Phe)-imidazoG37] synthetase (radical SAM superfamily) [Desulfobotulus alkaliphilus]
MHNREIKDFQYVFGPVASRRLGLSLGVDLLPSKTCTLDCIYCESGPTTRKTLLRKEWVPTEAVIAELAQILDESPELDSVTFSGSGEPTLHTGIGRIIDTIHGRWPGYPVTVLTNGTLFWQEEVRNDLIHADRIIANYDAASPEVFETLNRPYPGLFPDRMLEGLVAFREIFTGELWLEIFVIPGINDRDREIDAIAAASAKIRPDRVQLNTLDRPGTESWVTSAGDTLLERFQRRIAAAELTGKVQCAGNAAAMDEEQLKKNILSMVLRRPVTLEDVVRTQGVDREKAFEVLSGMRFAKSLGVQKMPRGDFYVLP